MSKPKRSLVLPEEGCSTVLGDLLKQISESRYPFLEVMGCEICQVPTTVVDGRPTKKGFRRRRVCLKNPNHRFTTYELRKPKQELSYDI